MRIHELALGGLLATTALGASAVAAPLQTVFVIAMENHNFTQPPSDTSPAQILGNPAAPYVNSLITPGNTNAAMTSFATNYQNAAAGVHPRNRTTSGPRPVRTSATQPTPTRPRPTATSTMCRI